MDCDNSDYSDFSDEELGMQKKALHVEIPRNFDPTKIPQNGEEYLQQVMFEARSCPSFMVAPLKNKEILHKPTFEVPIKENCMKAPKSMIPSMSWQDEAVEDFTKFREFIFKQVGTNSKIMKSSDAILLEEPTFSRVVSLSQEDKIQLLGDVLRQLGCIKKGESISGQLAVWVYSLLSTLDTPLCPDTCHILREIARKCSQIRSGLKEDSGEEDYKALNLYICLIARYFRQLDLADE